MFYCTCDQPLIYSRTLPELGSIWKCIGCGTEYVVMGKDSVQPLDEVEPEAYIFKIHDMWGFSPVFDVADMSSLRWRMFQADALQDAIDYFGTENVSLWFEK